MTHSGTMAPAGRKRAAADVGEAEASALAGTTEAGHCGPVLRSLLSLRNS
jgi:hypothetical protein